MTVAVSRENEARASKLAANESAFRDANEKLSRAAMSYQFDQRQRVPFFCECADPGCREIVMLTLVEYEHIRAHPTWFLLVAGHEDAEANLERIVDAAYGYAVVEKGGAAGREARRLHPRNAR
jgi:formate-nitrite transporter family protein